MTHINGVGGAFIFSEDPKRLAGWYRDHLGLQFEGNADFGAFYTTFVTVDANDPELRRDTTLSIMKARQPLEKPDPDPNPSSMYGDQPFMVNLRTDNLAALLDRLTERGVPILGQQNESYGAFAWVYDADGNRVELYQPLRPGP